MATLLLNADSTPLKVLGIKEVMSHLRRNKSYVVEKGKMNLTTADGKSFNIPDVMQLKRFVKIRYKKPRCTRNIIFFRDHFICQYCGDDFSKNVKLLTIDHVVPKCKGGQITFDNAVTACKSCNEKKADKTPTQAKMPLIRPIVTLRYYCMAMYKIALLYPEWKKYIRW